jgi:RNA recognition motif-containing protein
MVRKLQARGEPRKGRGFGFVTLASEEQQKKAVAEMNGKEVDGREIAVKVAIDVSLSQLAVQYTANIFSVSSCRARGQGERRHGDPQEGRSLRGQDCSERC